MSESFGDLWASSNPVKSQQPPQRTLSTAVSSVSNVKRRTTPDAFSMLASAGSSQPNSRPITPSIKQLVTSKNGSTSAGDAFGGLVSFGGSNSRDDSLTIAERAAKVEQERRERTQKNQATLDSQGSFWDQYEGPSIGKTLSPPAKSNSSGWGLEFLTPEPTLPTFKQNQPPKAAGTNSNHDTWDLDFMSSEPPLSNANPVADIFDIDHLATLGNGQITRSTAPSRTNTPGSFDFGDREDRLVGTTQDEDEDDILGSLAKPVEAVRGVSPKPSHKPPSAVSAKQPPSRTSSPPPHILGKIVEMGFSVQQAKVALAATPTGHDVDAALEILLQNISSTSSKLEEETNEARPELKRAESSLGSQNALQEQADKLLAQASTIGMTMFSKANAFWKEGREKVVRAYEDQRSGNAGAEASNGKDRPKWMGNVAVGEDRGEISTEDGRPRRGRAVVHLTRSMPDPGQHKPPVSLFVDEAEPMYRSPARRRPPASTSMSVSKAPSPSPACTPATPPPIVRPVVDATPSALSTSSTYKANGTEHFKLGRFAEAEVAYSRAIDKLPASHLLCVPLYNNRALTRLKTGEYKGTIHDASEVLRIVRGDAGTTWHPARETAGVRDSLGDAVGKALRRRAEAYEGLEKWKEATDDWESLSIAAWVGHVLKGDAVKGAARCRRMATGFGPKSSPSVSVKSKPRPKFMSTRTTPPTRPSEALSRVRAANTAQENEEQERHDLKDVVDARLATWRTGKETNLRALIASLDTVLSPTFGWQKVGMAELVSQGQVKLRYTKAIAKLHPDKLNVKNTTLEERMIANGVFGTLNDAWIASR